MKTGSNPNAIKALYSAFSQLRTPAEAEQFLQDICTPNELQAMADRWLVVKPIKDEVPYREINQMTGVSVTTIGRVARVIRSGRGGYDLVYKRLGN